jgi:hypothetical protein
MTGLLRFVGILNAAVWCGSAIFLVVALPPLFSAEMKRLLGLPGVGFAAQTIVARFFVLQYACAAIALAHLIGEWVYIGRPLLRLNLALLTGLMGLALLGGLWMQPKLRDLHQRMYYGATVELKDRAAKSFRVWHAGSQSANLLVIAGLLLYLWKVAEAPEHPRFVRLSKIRS